MYTSYGLIINELNNITFKKTKLRVVMSFKSFAKKVFFSTNNFFLVLSELDSLWCSNWFDFKFFKFDVEPNQH